VLPHHAHLVLTVGHRRLQHARAQLERRVLRGQQLQLAELLCQVRLQAGDRDLAPRPGRRASARACVRV
jgi:hypothetical protein